MYRLRAPSEAIRGAASPVLTEAFALVTELGGVAFLLVLLSVLYWADDRETTATVIGYALVAIAVTLALKSWFGLPRPPEAVRAVPVDPDSYGFPSGHAIASTVVYGGLLLVRDRITAPRIAGPTAILVGLIGLSRVVIGVHYLGDVLVGHAVGAVLLAGLWWTTGRRPVRACLVAIAAAAVGVAVTGGGTDSLLALGASVGGLGAFLAVDTSALPAPSGFVETAWLVAVGLPFVGGLYWLATTVALLQVAALGHALIVAAVVALPVAFQGGLPTVWSAIRE